MSYRIILSDHARIDLRNIYEHIAYVLLEPNIAAKKTRQILKEIENLKEMPKRFRIYPDEPMTSREIRFFPVEKYLVFYKVSESHTTVMISRVIYGGRDIGNQLMETLDF